MCTPSSSQSRRRIGSRELVAVTMMSAPLTASSTESTTRTPLPASASAFSRVRLTMRTSSMLRTSGIASRCDSPCTPAPMMASVCAFSRASSFVATAETAAVRMAVIADAFMTASNWPFSPSCSSTAPRCVSRPRGGIAGEDADLLQPVARNLAASVRRHQSEEAARVGGADDAPQRVVHFAARQRRQRLLHHLDALAHRQQLLDLVLVQNQHLAHGSSSRCTVSMENAGKHTAMYSAPSAPGVEYCTHSPLCVMTASPAPTSIDAVARGDAQRAAQDDRVFVKLRRLSRLDPSTRTVHPRHAARGRLRVDASDELFDPLRLVTRPLRSRRAV